MQYILLSGGSGKRLWPLSNEIRSKQFIKLLKKESGEYESMIQRVYRQINDADKNANIIIATSSFQEPQIVNQLGNKVDISIEPTRKDTFPAIVLSALYLKDKKNTDLNEYVIVCPVDSYIDTEFYLSLDKLCNKLKNSDANLGLIGIKPTYPSEKYGYILFENSNFKAFTEKPNESTAKNYINKGALWNGGVFCFKLKYIIDKAHELIDFDNYDDLYKKYDTLEKISFDYAIVEKEKNIVIEEYDGDWSDIGTWNTLTDILDDITIGDSIIDEKSTNTNIVNELNIPIVGMGLKDLVVVASPDGILVSDKIESAKLKNVVDKLDNRPMYEERKWGDFKILEMYKNSLVKHLFIRANENLSYQKHNHRDEVWTIVDGEGIFVLDDKESRVKIGDTLIIKKGQKHLLKAIKDLHFIEVQYGEELSEDDIERYEYKWQ